jgi:hypothetical protein
MADPSFVLHLGGSVYLAPDGSVLSAVPLGATAYPAVDLNVDPRLLAAALREFIDVQVSSEEMAERWYEASGDDPTVEMLIKAANIVAIAGSIALSVAQPAALVVLAMVGGIVSGFGGGDGFDARTVTALERLRQRVLAQADLAEADTLLQMRAGLQGNFEAVRSLASDLYTHQTVGQARLDTFREMRRLVDVASGDVVRVRDEDWHAVNEPDNSRARFSLSSVLVRLHPDGSTGPVDPRDDRLTRFDPRLGVPMLLWVGTAYAAMVRLAVPWMRTDGSFRDQLRQLAGRIDDFVAAMQRECWARTEHTDRSLLWGEHLYNSSPFDRHIGPGTSLELRGTFPVGAFDLVRYSDSYLWTRWITATQNGTETGDMGLLDYTWQPAPGLVDRFGRPVRLDLLREAANAQARADYARLVVTSGAAHLMLTSAMLRHLSAPPTRSETLSGGATAGRTPVGDAATTAESPPIFPNRRVSVEATLRRYESRARVRLQTQQPGHNPAVTYRVGLRTVNSRFGPEGWRADGYEGRVWDAKLVPLADDPRNMQLRTEVHPELMLGEVPAFFEGTSPATAWSQPRRTVELTASTFDWYVPVRSSPWAQRPNADALALDKHFNDIGADGALPGSRSVHLTGALRSGPHGPMAVRGWQRSADAVPLLPALSSAGKSYGDLTRTTLNDAFDMSDRYVARSDVDLSAAERRHVREETVTLGYELHWADGELEVALFGSPFQRPFQVWVVVEEAVQSGVADGSRQWLHTAIAAELVNQAVLVPESFFREEAEALEEASRLWNELQRRFSEAAEVRPGDAVAQIIDLAHEAITLSPSTATLAQALTDRIEAMQQHHPDLWEQVIGNG